MERLIQLVRRMGFDYAVSGDEVHVVFSSGAAKWQAAFRAGERRVLIYSVYPFKVESGQKAVEACNRVNAALVNSCFYYEARSGRVVVRSIANLTDGYYAFELFKEAVRDHCRDVLSQWDAVFRAAAGDSHVDLNREKRCGS